ncbi:fkbp-rapamycin associated protein, putative [Babesia caballi]|uniref:Fkbp-rapamycin associated protein, putative n=1 Tax=Babesia caballi TaxID=5871 RepID=A0AAV4LSV8_BABCB|nr:fkbp-rapamycin associated protein, putative [Babesia caballi]
MRAGLASVNIWGQEPLAVEVKSHGTAGKRQIPTPAAFLMAPPIDIGEGLVVEGEAAEENLGALLDCVIVTTHFAPRGTLVVRRVLARLLNLGDECCGGVADRGEDGGVGD